MITSHALLVLRMRVSSRRKKVVMRSRTMGRSTYGTLPPLKLLKLYIVDELVYTIASINISSVFDGPIAISVVFTNISRTGIASTTITVHQLASYKAIMRAESCVCVALSCALHTHK